MQPIMPLKLAHLQPLQQSLQLIMRHLLYNICLHMIVWTILSCFNGSISDPVSPWSRNHICRIEASGGNSLDDDFDVCVNYNGGAFDCYSASFMPSRPEYPNENLMGHIVRRSRPFCLQC